MNGISQQQRCSQRRTLVLSCSCTSCCPNQVLATWHRRAQTSMRAELPSGKLPTTKVWRWIPGSALSDIVGANASPSACEKSQQAVSLQCCPPHSQPFPLDLWRTVSTAFFFSQVAFLPPWAWRVLIQPLHLGAKCDRENVIVEVHSTPLVLSLEEHFSHNLQHTQATIANHQLDSV